VDERLSLLDPQARVNSKEAWPVVPAPVADDYKEKLGQFLGLLVCERAGAPFVARRIVLLRKEEETGIKVREIAPKLKEADAAKCPGGIGLTQFERNRLDEMAQPSSE